MMRCTQPRAVVEEGILPGGDVALLRAVDALAVARLWLTLQK
jgi:hypothetical protein